MRIEERVSNGFTLLETLVATVIITIGVISIIGAFNTGMFASSEKENVNLALRLAEERMEYIKKIGYNFTNDTKATVTGFPAFQREATMSNVTDNLNQANVTVYWQTKGGETNVTLTTFLASY